jgi:hypothetical protein
MESISSQIDTFTIHYIEAMLWAETANDAPELTDDNDDRSFHDLGYDADCLAPEALEKVKADCAKFQEQFGHLFEGQEEEAGHDFWMNRNGHGAGFWDGDWPEPQATTLDEGSKAFGQVNMVYVGDDEQIYLD